MSAQLRRLDGDGAVGVADEVRRCYGQIFDDADSRELHAARDGFRLVTASEGERVVGFAWGFVGQPGQYWSDLVRSTLPSDVAARWVGGHFELVELGVLPHARRGGLGQQLHDALLDGVGRRCLLSTADDPDDPAVRLYRRAGWRRLGALRDGVQVMGLDRRESFEPELAGGIEKRALVLVEHDPAWAAAYAEHEARIRAALGDTALSIEHIGSTSVPGLAAKPIVDVLVSVPDITADADHLDRLVAAGYVARVREPRHRLARTPELDAHLHLLEPDDPAAGDYLLLRDHLRADEADRALYEQTKRELVAQDWPDMNAYADAKTAVITEIKDRARRRLRPAPTERLRFRQMTTADRDDVATLDISSRHGAASWIDWTLRNYAEHGFGLWVVETHDGEFVGDCGLTMQDVEGTPHVEIGWHVRADLRRRGYAAEAAASVRETARAAGMAHLVAIIRPDNVASQAVARRIGLSLEREVTAHGGPALVFGADLA